MLILKRLILGGSGCSLDYGRSKKIISIFFLGQFPTTAAFNFLLCFQQCLSYKYFIHNVLLGLSVIPTIIFSSFFYFKTYHVLRKSAQKKQRNSTQAPKQKKDRKHLLASLFGLISICFSICFLPYVIVELIMNSVFRGVFNYSVLENEGNSN